MKNRRTIDGVADLQPTLRGSLVTARPLRADDFPALYAVASDSRLWEQHPSPDRYTEPVFKQFFREAMASQGALLVHDACDGRVIGSSRYHGLDPEKCEIEIGWTFLARSHWGGTYNHELKQLMLRHAFRFVDRVVFLIGSNNLRSRRAVEKIGATLAGAKTTADGVEHVIYAITVDAFERGLGARKIEGETCGDQDRGAGAATPNGMPGGSATRG
jgi:RimJ/RimL family protein N-acetyltransferase